MIQIEHKHIPTKILSEIGRSILPSRIEVTKWTCLIIRWGGDLVNWWVGGVFDNNSFVKKGRLCVKFEPSAKLVLKKGERPFKGVNLE